MWIVKDAVGGKLGMTAVNKSRRRFQNARRRRVGTLGSFPVTVPTGTGDSSALPATVKLTVHIGTTHVETLGMRFRMVCYVVR